MKLKLKHPLLILLFAFLIVSCKNNKEETIENDTTEIEVPSTLDIVKADTTAIVADLQGKWKETEYPYRTVEFKDDKVKFVEEGVVDPPAFQNYAIASTSPGRKEDANNSKQLFTYLYLPEKKLCQKITVADGQLILSGTTQDYRIVYDKME